MIAVTVVAFVVASRDVPSATACCALGAMRNRRVDRVRHRRVRSLSTIRTSSVPLGRALPDRRRHLWPHSRR